MVFLVGFGRILQHFTLHFGAYYTAFWCKLQCVLMQNAMRFAAYCTVFCCKIRCNI